MKRAGFSENVRTYALGLGLGVALLLLAALQYRSNRQLRDVLQKQMRSTLQGSLMNVRFGVEQELSPICNTLLPVPNSRPGDWERYARGFERWRRSAVHPGLVANVSIYEQPDYEQPELFQLRSDGSKFEAVAWPGDLIPLRRKLNDMAAYHSAALPLWLIDENIPALVHPFRGLEPGHERTSFSFLIVRLDLQELSQHILPELVQRYLGSNGHLDYQVAMSSRNAAGSVIYSSEEGFGGRDDHTTDAQLNVFGPPMAPMSGGPPSASFGSTIEQFSSALRDSSDEPRPNGLAALSPHGGSALNEPFLLRRDPGPLRLEAIRYAPGDGGWTLIARHRTGSVEAAVAAVYHRSLAISFGVLLVLAGMIVMIVLTTRRAHYLARLQMDFVTSVSHELRTPLTGIVSAAQNVADGLIDNKERAMRYGTAILGQAQQLSELIEQILLFSATGKGLYRYHLQWLEIPEVIEASLKGTASLVRSSRIRVEPTIDPDLPQIRADFKALTHCLQNLITNSVKYRGESRWIGIRAHVEESAGRGKEVVITVADKGVGISPADLKNIFDPFYRSPAVTGAQIHGSGLGLSIAKDVAQAMGGQLTVESQLGKGSSFSIHLPADKRSLPREDTSENADVETAADR